MGKGKIVVLEGLDGCGKGVQLRLLARIMGVSDDSEYRGRSDLQYHGRNVVFTREPGGTPFAEKVRAMIFSEKDLSGRTQMLNFFAARSDHWERVIIPAVERGDLVISDRGFLSTFAFQLCGQCQTLPLDDLHVLFRRLVEVVCGEYQPNRHLFIDVSPQECQRRLREAAIAEQREVTHFDTREMEFQYRVRDGYRDYAKGDPYRIVTINGERSIEEVHGDVVGALNSIL